MARCECVECTVGGVEDTVEGIEGTFGRCWWHGGEV